MFIDSAEAGATKEVSKQIIRFWRRKSGYGELIPARDDIIGNVAYSSMNENWMLVALVPDGTPVGNTEDVNVLHIKTTGYDEVSIDPYQPAGTES